METIDDIVREMRQYYGSKIREYSYRIELAHAKLLNKIQQLEQENAKLKDALKMTTTAMCNYCQSTPEAKGLPCLNGCHMLAIAKAALESDHESCAKCSCAGCVFRGMELCEHRKAADKIARLKAALKPVLDIVMDSATSDLSMELAITEAKRIYNEGKEEANEDN